MIKRFFVDGVLYLSLGAAATAGEVATELSKIVRLTGSVSGSKIVQSSPSLTNAISTAADWFFEKCILFIVDDIWPASSHPDGFLFDLGKLLNGSPLSRIAISTRSRMVAVGTGSYADFSARDRQGSVEASIFISYAAPGIQWNKDKH